MDTPHVAPENRSSGMGLGTRSDVHRRLAVAVWVLAVTAVVASGSDVATAPAFDVLAWAGWTAGLCSTATIGALVVRRGRGALAGWLLLTVAAFAATGLLVYHVVETFPHAPSVRAGIAAAEVAFTLGGHSLVFLLLTLPDGRLPSRGWRWFAWLIAGNAVLWTVQSVVVASRVVDLDAWLARSSWTSMDGAVLTGWVRFITSAGTVVGFVTIVLLAVALVVRYRSSSGEARQQLKWVVMGGGGVLAWWLLWLPQADAGWTSGLQSLLPGLALASLAAGIGLALFRYRLWDVDVFVRRSAVYAVLWLAIALTYAGAAAALGLAAEARLQVEGAIALTVVATLAFQPARARLEHVADRTVFGRRESPAQALRSLTDSPDVARALADAARAAVGAAWVEVALHGAIPARAGDRRFEDGVVEVDVEWAGERFGTMRCAPHRGESLDADDVALLRALAAQAALSTSHAHLASRIVHAQDDERRRIERDIHDGVQQDLATLVATIGLARARGDGAAVLDEVRSTVQRILGDIRELAQGIHPSVLRDGGLVEAVDDRCSRLSLRATLRVDGPRSRRFGHDAEAAAYFVVCEAIANAVKHSAARSIDVRLRLGDDELLVEVADDGAGFDSSSARSGSGLRGLADRVRALGGALVVDTRPGAGTRVVATLPATAQMPA